VASDPARRKPKVLVAIQDPEVRRRLQDLLDSAAVDLEVLEPEVDPLQEPPNRAADLLVVRRSEVRQQDLRLVDAYSNDESKPGLVILREKGGDADRARLMAAGATGVLETVHTNRELRENLEALAAVEFQGGSHGPQSAGGDPEPRLADFLSRSPRMQRFLDLVQRVVDTDSSLLITGETGVGKERLARAIHNEGAREKEPFVSVNCGAIPEQLLESELFGHEVGAFTGANRKRKGRFEQATGGTIFLDEIGEMPSHLQVNLLTVLQRRKVQRVGSEDTVRVDVRVMAATNRDVTEDVKTGRFREDLYYRLNVVSLGIPAVRERTEDIPDLAGRFISYFRDALGRPEVGSISDEALEAMMGYEWPGNVRELVNAVEHAVVLCRTSQITLEDLPDRVVGRVSGVQETRTEPTGTESRTAVRDDWLALPLREARRRVGIDFERSYIDALLAKACGKIGETAELAGITPRSLYDKMKRHGLRKEDYR
jgi:DNA-binding NtrC family response regulator